MAAVIMDIGKRQFLDFLSGFGGVGLSGVRYHLYTNNVAPAHGDALATYTEAVFAGYVAQAATGWLGSILTGDFHATTNASPIVFTNNSGVSQSVFGYYVTDSSNTILLFAERFAAPPVTILNGSALNLVPNVRDQSEF